MNIIRNLQETCQDLVSFSGMNQGRIFQRSYQILAKILTNFLAICKILAIFFNRVAWPDLQVRGGLATQDYYVSIYSPPGPPIEKYTCGLHAYDTRANMQVYVTIIQ